MKIKLDTRVIEILLIAVMALTLVGAGGYFVYISCFITILLMGALLCMGWTKKKWVLQGDINLLTIGMVVGFYLLAAIWAVDSGMALFGFFKYLPMLLFFLLVNHVADKKERLIGLLPLMGSLMTIFSFVMMQFEVFKPYVSVAGRLAGFFQYSNTYAIFMLVCLIVAVFSIDLKKPDWLPITHVIIAIFGIYMSGSRTVFILTALTILGLAFWKKEVRRFALPVFAIGILVAVVWVLFGSGEGAFVRFTDISMNSSTLLGRFLYYKDAIPVILKHPFGMGYYGYYFVQQSIQTGVYSVVNVHNELLQLMLDIGIIPAILFYGCLGRSIFSKGISIRNRMVLWVLMLHSLLDYDFQFIGMMLVLVLFLKEGKTKEWKTGMLTKVVTGIAAVLVCIGIVCIGGSELMYTRGNYETAVKLYDGNTMAKTALLTEVETAQEMEQLAEEILAVNKYSSLAYAAKARVAFSRGQIEEFITYKQQAIRLAPYQFGEYLDYIDCLYLALVEYIKNGDTTSATYCLGQIEDVEGMLKSVQEKTSAIAWEINDIPQVTLPQEYKELLEMARKELNK